MSLGSQLAGDLRDGYATVVCFEIEIGLVRHPQAVADGPTVAGTLGLDPIAIGEDLDLAGDLPGLVLRAMPYLNPGLEGDVAAILALDSNAAVVAGIHGDRTGRG